MNSVTVTDAIGSSLQSFGGKLACRKCGAEKPLGKVADYLLNGWPMCCGETIVWHIADEGSTDESNTQAQT